MARIPARTLLVMLLVGAAVAAPTAARAGTRALAAGGEVYVATAGTYGELFPGGSAAAAEAPVLALTVIYPDGSTLRHLVPGTEGDGLDSSPSLYLGPNHDSVHLLWQAGDADGGLRLASLADGEWHGAIDVSRSYPVLSGSTRVAVTHDTGELPSAGGETLLLHRSVLHTIWISPGDAGDRVVYAPLAIENGAYVGDHALYTLADFGPPAPAGGGTAPEAGAAGPLAPTVQAGSDGRAAVASFTDPATGRLITLELRLVSADLSLLGDVLRRRLLELGNTLPPGSPDSLSALADGARGQLINVGSRLDPAARGYLAAAMETYILETGGDWAFQLDAMVERTRDHLLELAIAFDGAPLARLAGGARGQLINVGHHLEGLPLSHDLRLRRTAERPAPDTGGAAGSVFLSADGEEALVAWERQGVVYFRDSDGAAWGPVRSLGLELASDPSTVTDLLTERVRAR